MKLTLLLLNEAKFFRTGQTGRSRWSACVLLRVFACDLRMLGCVLMGFRAFA